MVIVANSHLHDPPILQQVPDQPTQYRLVDDFRYVHRECFSIEIKKGFLTDGASIPRFLWTVCGSPFSGTYTVPAILHDALYSICAWGDRYECDSTFYEAMQDWGSSWVTRSILYRGVRIGGGAVWSSHTVESCNRARRYVNIH